MNLEQARNNMVEQQIRTWEVLDELVLEAMAAVPRELFVPAQYRGIAFSDTEIPLGRGEVMLQPKLQARMMQALALSDTDHVLEVGTGSGYGAALLQRLAGSVVSVDIHEDFVARAQGTLARAGCPAVSLASADGLDGYPPAAPYEAIMVTGACAEMPDTIAMRLRPGGRMVVVCGTGAILEARLVTRIDSEQLAVESLFETRIPYLKGAEPRPRFEF